MSSGVRLLDLFCGSGGCSMGYHRAGFDVTGVDNRPMPRYPFEFYQADALEFLAKHGHEFDVIHASPPCHRFSRLQSFHGIEYSDLVGPTRDLLGGLEKPYVIENVVGAPLLRPILLCGTMFDLRVYRHRIFESNIWNAGTGFARTRDMSKRPRHGPHAYLTQSRKGVSRGMPFISVAGHMFRPAEAASAMRISWMTTAKELAQAIPPDYTEWIGSRLMEFLHDRRDVRAVPGGGR